MNARALRYMDEAEDGGNMKGIPGPMPTLYTAERWFSDPEIQSPIYQSRAFAFEVIAHISQSMAILGLVAAVEWSEIYMMCLRMSGPFLSLMAIYRFIGDTLRHGKEKP